MATAISQFRDRVLQYVPGCPIPAIDRAVVESMRRLCEDTHCFEKTIEAIHSVDVDWPFAMPFSFEQASTGGFYLITIDFTGYTALTGYHPIMPVYFQINGVDWTLGRYDVDHLVSNLDDVVPTGMKYFKFNDVTEMEIFPFQDGEDVSTTIITSLAMKPADTSTSVDDVFFNEYLDAIVFKTASYLQMIPKRPWSDYDQAQINMNRYGEERSKINFQRRVNSSRPKVFKGYI